MSNFLSDVVVRMGSHGIVFAVRIVSAVLIARLLGPEAKGVITLCILIPSMLHFIMYFGIGDANTYLCGQDRSRAAEVVESTNFLLLVFILIGTIVYLGGFPLWKVWLAKHIEPRYLYLTFIIFPVTLAWSYFASTLQGLGKIKTVAIGQTLNNCVYILLLVTLIVGMDLGVMGALVAFIIGGLVELAFVTVHLYRNVVWGFRIRTDTLREQATYGIKTFAGSLFNFITYRVDYFIINFFLTTAHLGIYSIATAAAEVIRGLSGTAAIVLFPHAAASGDERIKNLTPIVCRIIIGISLVIAAVFFFLAQPLVEGVFGKPFASAALPMKILLPGVVMLSIEQVLKADLMGRGLPLYGSQAAALGFVATIVLDFLLIPRWGIVGAASASTIAYSCSTLYIIYRYTLTSRVSLEDFLMPRPQDAVYLLQRLANYRRLR